jgi:hypothetical protein
MTYWSLASLDKNLGYRNLLPSRLSFPLKFGGADPMRLSMVRIGRVLIL